MEGDIALADDDKNVPPPAPEPPRLRDAPKDEQWDNWLWDDDDPVTVDEVREWFEEEMTNPLSTATDGNLVTSRTYAAGDITQQDGSVDVFWTDGTGNHYYFDTPPPADYFDPNWS